MLAIRVLFWCLIFITIWLILAGITNLLLFNFKKKLSSLPWKAIEDITLFSIALVLTFLVREQQIDSRLVHQYLYRTRIETWSQSFIQKVNETPTIQAIAKKNHHNFGITFDETLLELHRYGLPLLPTNKLLDLARLRLILIEAAHREQNYELCLSFLKQQSISEENLLRHLDALSDSELQSYFEIQYKALVAAADEIHKSETVAGRIEKPLNPPLRAQELFPLVAIEKAMDFNEAFLLRQLLRFPQYLSSEKKCQVYEALLKTYSKLTPSQQLQLAPWIF